MSIKASIGAAANDIYAVSPDDPPVPDALAEQEKDVLSKYSLSEMVRACGGNRVVLECGQNDSVLKLARNVSGREDGKTANNREYNQFQVATSEQQQLLAPVSDVYAGGLVLKMERATRVYSGEAEIPSEFFTLCDDAGLDLSADSIRWAVGEVKSRDNPVLIDFGHPIGVL